jgi:hypothetical protein
MVWLSACTQHGAKESPRIAKQGRGKALEGCYAPRIRRAKQYSECAIARHACRELRQDSQAAVAAKKDTVSVPILSKE